MKIAVSCESTVDLPEELLDKFKIDIIPFTVLLGEESGLDGKITPQEIFDYVDRTGLLPKTSAVNEFQFEEHFSKLLKNHEAIIHLSLSSALSSAYVNAKNAASKFNNVYVIDSQTLSTGIALLAVYTRELIENGEDLIDIVDKVKERRRSVQASFVVNTLDYLYKGGRCTSLQRFGANLLKLKPQILVQNGNMISNKKYRGRNSAVIADYCRDTLNQFNNPDLSIAFLTHSYASPDMIDTAKNALISRGFKNIYITTAGATITSHCGPKCLGILYINDGIEKDF